MQKKIKARNVWLFWKMKFYEKLLGATLMYGAQAWVVSVREHNKLDLI